MVSRRGASILEVEVALVILAVAFLATVAVVVEAGSLTRRAVMEEGAARLAAEVLDSLGQHGAPVAGARVRGPWSAAWTVARDSADVTRITVAVRYPDGRGARADTFTAHAAPWPRRIHAP